MQSIEDNSRYNSDEPFDDLLEILSVIEQAVTQLFYDVVKSWTCLAPNARHELIERFSYLVERVVKLSPQWCALCDADASMTCATQL